MTKRVVKIKRIFLLLQTIILLSVLLIFVAVVASGYIHKAREKIKDDLNTTTHMIVDHIKKDGSIPERAIDSYLFFVIDQRDGSYVVERKDSSDQSKILWEQYRTKLTYQMQKQERGWITYPMKTSRQYFKDSKIIRYLTIQEIGWIVVVEKFMPSEGHLLQNIINRNNLANLLLIAFFGFVILKLMTDNYFTRLEKQISESYHGHFLDFSHAAVKNTPLEAEFKGDVQEQDQEPDEVVQKEETESKPLTIFPETGLGAKFDQKLPVHEARHQERDEPEKSFNNPEPLVNEDKETRPSPMSGKPKEQHALKSDKPSDHWTVKMQGIKSPVLRKLLKELRHNKEKV